MYGVLCQTPWSMIYTTLGLRRRAAARRNEHVDQAITAAGLLAPVVRDVAALGLRDVAACLADLTKRADARQRWLAQIDTYRQEWDKFVAPGFSDDAAANDAHQVECVVI